MAEVKAGAKAPATVTVRGIEITPNAEFAKSWAAFDLQLTLADEGASQPAKMRAYVELVEGMTGMTRDELVDAAGGPTAPATDVVAFMAEVVQACTPKA